MHSGPACKLRAQLEEILVMVREVRREGEVIRKLGVDMIKQVNIGAMIDLVM